MSDEDPFLFSTPDTTVLAKIEVVASSALTSAANEAGNFALSRKRNFPLCKVSRQTFYAKPLRRWYDNPSRHFRLPRLTRLTFHTIIEIESFQENT